MPPKTRGKGGKGGKGKGKAVNRTPPEERTPPAPPTPRTEFAPQFLDQDQSVELMRIVSTAVISRIAFARNLFPALEMKYERRTFDPADPDPSYDAFIRGDKGTQFFEREGELRGLWSWKLLPRGAHPTSDKVLHWLENGVADALKSGYLERLQLTIHSAGAEISESNLIESYTIKFENTGMQLSSSSQRSNKTVLISVAKDQLCQLVSDVMDELSPNNTNNFIPLPRYCQINMNLAYNGTCPPEYQAPGFRPADADIKSVLTTSSTDPRFTMRTPFHSVSIGWRIPPSTSNTSNEPARHKSLGRLLPGQQDAALSPQRFTPNALLRGAYASMGEGNTQAEAMEAFKAMGKSRQLHSSTQDTQPVSPPYTQAFASGFNAQINIPSLPYSDAINALLTQARMEEVEAPEKGDRQQATGVECECNVTERDALMIECKLCGTHQHAPCYGYLGHCPSVQVCYTCLFQTDPDKKGRKHRIKEMKAVCVNRRVLFYLREHNKLTKQELQTHLGSLSIDEILNSLHKEGYIELPSPAGRGKGEDPEGQMVLEFVGTEQALLQNYFNPKKNIHDMLQPPNATTGQGIFSIGDDEASLPGPPVKDFSDSPSPTPTYSGNAAFTRRLNVLRDVGDSSTEGEPSSPINGSTDQQLDLPQIPQTLKGGSRNDLSDLTQAQVIGRKRKAPAAAPIDNPVVQKKIWNPAQARTPPNLDRSRAIDGE